LFPSVEAGGHWVAPGSIIRTTPSVIFNSWKNSTEDKDYE
jgi:hypothetical protein